MINYSVIIPHYNTPDLLSRCLRSIPEREDIQIIVIDDNSPGNAHFNETIPELSRSNVEWTITTDGLGAGHARNIGLRKAKGKWLIFSDSDDFFVDNFAEILDEYVNDEHDIIYFNVNVCDCYDISRVYEGTGKGHIFNKYLTTGNDVFFRVCYTEPWGKFIKRSIVTDNNISFQETKAHNDLMFSIQVGLKANKILAIDRPLYWYVIREGSLGHQKGEEPFAKICDRIRAWDMAQNFLNQNNIRTKIYLPVFPCLVAMRKNFKTYIKLLSFMKKNNYRFFRAIIDTFRLVYLRIKNGSVITLKDVIVVDFYGSTPC